MTARPENILANLIATRADELPDFEVLTFEGGGVRPDEVRSYRALWDNARRLGRRVVLTESDHGDLIGPTVAVVGNRIGDPRVKSKGCGHAAGLFASGRRIDNLRNTYTAWGTVGYAFIRARHIGTSYQHILIPVVGKPGDHQVRAKGWNGKRVCRGISGRGEGDAMRGKFSTQFEQVKGDGNAGDRHRKILIKCHKIRSLVTTIERQSEVTVWVR